MKASEIRDAKLAAKGRQKISWAQPRMQVLNEIRRRFTQEKPFKGLTLGVCVHLEAKTAYLAMVLRDGGAKVAVSGSNPLSTQDDVASALAAEKGIRVYSWHGASETEMEGFYHLVLDARPQVLVDDGADLVKLLHTSRTDIARGVWGGAEETTTGILRLRALANSGELKFPMLAVNDAKMKHLFDNRYGTGQATWDGIMRNTNLTVAGSTVVVCGYGWCSRGIARCAQGLGGRVIVTEVDPVKAIEAVMDGYQVLPIEEAAAHGDFFVTSTGNIDVITRKALRHMKDGAILANAGHFDVEVSKPDLRALSKKVTRVRPNVDEYLCKDGRRLYLLCEGRLVNIAGADGHPVEIMDTSFAVQALAAEYVCKQKGKLKPGLYAVPDEIDESIARLKLAALGVSIDALTRKQRRYLETWR